MMKMDGILDLPSGRRIYLIALQQYQTYEGLLEGLPTAERNQQRLENLIALREGKPYPDGPTILIPPIERPIDYSGRYPFGTPSALPSITCIGRFQSHQPARDLTSDGSGLVVMWFQDQWAFPIDPVVLSQLSILDWENRAEDLIY